MHPLKRGEINGAIAILRGFTESIAKGEQTAVTAITDQSNPQVSAMLSTMLEKVMDGISTKIAEEKAKAVTATTRALTPMTPVVANPQALVKPFIVRQEGIVGGEPNYFQFMAPGIMAMVVVMAVMIGLAGAISRKREIGTLDGILIAPIDRLSIILGKTFSQAVRGFAQGAGAGPHPRYAALPCEDIWKPAARRVPSPSWDILICRAGYPHRGFCI